MGGIMTSTPVLAENKGNEPEIGVAPDSVKVGLGVLWIVGTTATWTVVLILFHVVVARLLS
jgi:hypothetical protein